MPIPDYSKNARKLALEGDLEHIRQIFSQYERRIEELEAENAELHSAHYADTELSRLKRKLEESRRNEQNAIRDSYLGFPISAEQKGDAEAWQAAHELATHAADDIHGTVGGAYAFQFVPTSIGTIGYVICLACGEKHCFQDLD